MRKMKYKTKLCHFYRSGTCANGESCRFAHGKSDVRIYSPPPSPWMPKVEGATYVYDENPPKPPLPEFLKPLPEQRDDWDWLVHSCLDFAK